MFGLKPVSFPVLLTIAFVVASFVPARPSSAQRAGDGSVYSRFGIGDLRSFGSSQAQAMGGDGFALGSPLRGNFSNPAAWGDQLFTRVQTGLSYESDVARNAADEQS